MSSLMMINDLMVVVDDAAIDVVVWIDTAIDTAIKVDTAIRCRR